MADWNSAQALYRLDAGQGRILAVADEKNDERFVINLSPIHDDYMDFINQGPLGAMGKAFNQFNAYRATPLSFFDYVKYLNSNKVLRKFPEQAAPPIVPHPPPAASTTGGPVATTTDYFEFADTPGGANEEDLL